MLLGKFGTVRCGIPTRFQALPRHRRPLASSTIRSSAVALRRDDSRVHRHTLLVKENPKEQPRQIKPDRGAITLAREELTRHLERTYSAENAARFTAVFNEYVKDDELMSSRSICQLLAQTAAHFRDMDRVMLTIEVAEGRGVSFSAQGYENIVRHCVRNRRWTHAYEISGLVMGTPALLTSRLLTLHARALVALGMYRQLDGIVEFLNEHDIRPTRKLYNIILRGSLEAQDIPWARRVLKQMEAHGFPFDSSTYTTILAGYRSLGPSADVESRIYESLHGLGLLTNTHCLNALAALRLEAGDVNGARSILSLFQTHTNTPTSDHIYGERSTALDEHGYVKASASNPFPPEPSQSSPRHIATFTQSQPALSTMNILMCHSAKEGDISRVGSMLQSIHNINLDPNETTLVAVIRAHLAQTPPMLNEAVSIVAIALYGAGTADASQFCQLVRVEEVETRFTNINARGIRPTSNVFNALLDGILRAGTTPRDLQGALLRVDGLLVAMKAAAIEPDAETLRLILAHLGENERLKPSELMSVLRDLGSTSHISEIPGVKPVPTPAGSPTLPSILPQVVPTIGHINAIIRSAARRYGVSSERQGASRGDHVDHAYDLASSSAEPMVFVREHSTLANSDTFTSNMRREARPLVARSMFNDMIARGIPPSAHHYLALMRAYTSSGNVSHAARILSAAVVAGLITTAAMFTVLIVAYGSNGRPDLAQMTFNRLKAQPHLTPDVASVDALARAYVAAGQASEAKKVILDHWAMVDKEFANRTPEFTENLKTLRLKALLYALSGLSGAQRKGGRKPVSQARRVATKRIVSRVLHRWKAPPDASPPKAPKRSPKREVVDYDL